MATRLGIELSAAAIRLIEVDGHWQPGTASRPPRVRSFAVLPPTGGDTDAMIASLKRREAAVLVWGTTSEHRQAVVTAGAYEAMRREGVASLASLGVDTNHSLADIAPVRGADGNRRPVVVAVAPAAPMLDAIRPLVAAGIRVRSLGTPAMALASMAHTRREVTEPDAIEAYIAVEETATCIALMRGGALAIARELPWGYIAGGAFRPHEDIVQRLATELEQYLDAVGAPRASQVCICGGQPELRTTAVLLTERLDVEVEPLDSLFGIDDTQLPEPSADFRDRVAELRLAWAVAADWPPRLNLLRGRRREQSRRALAAVAIVAGVVAGVGGAWRIARSDMRRVMRPAPRTALAPAGVPGQGGAAARGGPGAAAPKLGTESTPSPLRPHSVPTPSPVPPPARLLAARPIPRPGWLTGVVRPPEPALTPTLLASLRQPATSPVTASASAPQTPPVPPPLRQTSPSQVARTTPSPAPANPISPPPPVLQRRVPASPTPTPAPPTRTPAPATPSQVRPGSVPTPSPAPKPEPALPFDAALETILYSADRKLAIIDGRIVGVGDIVRGARIVEIAPTVVMLRDDRGRLRRLALGAGSK